MHGHMLFSLEINNFCRNQCFKPWQRDFVQGTSRQTGEPSAIWKYLDLRTEAFFCRNLEYQTDGKSHDFDAIRKDSLPFWEHKTADGFWMSKTLSIFYQSHKICGFWKLELPPFHKSWPETRWQTLRSPQTHGSTPCSAKSDAAWAKVPKIPENYWPLNSPNIWCILPMAPFCSIEILLSSQKSLKTVHRR